MTQKRNHSHHLADRWNQRPANKRNRPILTAINPNQNIPNGLNSTTTTILIASLQPILLLARAISSVFPSPTNTFLPSRKPLNR
ncbi:hypothetical protein PTTG_30141, partial [Puccinia triticina 1-1 BBBD Race 1]